MVVLSAKFTILISWSPICIPLILLSALMKLASTSATILYNSMESRHPWRTNTRIKGSDRRSFVFIFRFDIGAYNFNRVNEFVFISKLTQSRKDKINSKDITERFLFSLCDSSIMTQIVKRMCIYSKVILFLKASDWCSPIIVSVV